MLKKFWKDESGATAIEYGLIATFMAVSLIALLFALREQYEIMFGGISADFAAIVS